MRPFIFNGETVEITSADVAHLRRGHIILCWLVKDRLVLHRIVRVQKTANGNKFIVQGDAFCWPDGWIPSENVIGMATAVLRKGKWIALNAFPMILLAEMWLFTTPLRRIVSRLVRVNIK